MTNIGSKSDSGQSIKVKLISLVVVLSIVVLAAIIYLRLELQNEVEGASSLVEKSDQALLVVNASKSFNSMVYWFTEINISESNDSEIRAKNNERALAEQLDAIKGFMPYEANNVQESVSEVVLAYRDAIKTYSSNSSKGKALIEEARQKAEAVQKTFAEISKDISGQSSGIGQQLIEDADSALTLSNFMIIAILVIISVMIMIILSSVVKPLETLTSLMRKIAEGDYGSEVLFQDRGDEIGGMARALVTFRDNAMKAKDLEEQHRIAEEKSKIEKQEAMAMLANSFEERVQHIIRALASSSHSMSDNLKKVGSEIIRSSETARTASVDSKETSTNVESTAGSAHEMSASINEISSQLQRSNQLVEDSVRKVESADGHANALNEALHKVKEVLQLISNIAGQINLLALNATIESARAGEAGKGFAVVAGEVKNLANQTNNLIQEIENVIGEMNIASEDIVNSLSDIKGAVNQIFEASGSIASAVEEQSATTSEIADRMQMAAEGTQSIYQNLDIASEASKTASTSSQEVIESANSLSDQINQLDSQVETFLDEIRKEA